MGMHLRVDYCIKVKGQKLIRKHPQAKLHLRLVHMFLTQNQTPEADYRKIRLRDLMRTLAPEEVQDLRFDPRFLRQKAKLAAENLKSNLGSAKYLNNNPSKKRK